MDHWVVDSPESGSSTTRDRQEGGSQTRGWLIWTNGRLTATGWLTDYWQTGWLIDPLVVDSPGTAHVSSLYAINRDKVPLSTCNLKPEPGSDVYGRK